MEFSIFYFSRGGKTGKIAEAIADELGCALYLILKTETNWLQGFCQNLGARMRAHINKLLTQ